MKKLGRTDFFNLLTETQLETLFERERELEKAINEAGVDLSHYEQTYQFDEEKNTVFYIVRNEQGIDVYTLVFEIKNSVGRPSLGVTKKVSITLSEDIWEMIEQRKEELGVSQSQTLRMMIERYFDKDSE